ncbi:hypothetical protein M2164_003539 [Streptomyces sp. SAI-208]|uniref:hypothetical protein n=1 Tax=unclassified Streptomyces TaxID=2593676 RepID=UPI002476C6EA|nr:MULTISPECIES: hypothetical protein [unclassified Streptomyces]MDH6517084.1 hypothetical protein [Streptomyces sp. SAI-090]MDH6549299.1 hypothetical protein [Streptomyces sp. SAI-041]MDH6568364.1 hypothetical protein [Streptomyces sp. SAI-117]MDH6586687.1 hypothetical protein [Streptomyces sp. SAI-133]MDH6607904.1 hypothetical protein [Streptomyces sp. SAI-208]
MATSNAAFVTALTTAALATVGFLAYQAAATVPGRAHTGSTPAAVASKVPRDQRNPAALPPGSGAGRRVVYSLDDNRVWLVGADERVARTFEVAPGTIDPAPGVYAVTSRSNSVTGTDGIPIEHVVRFTSVDGVAIGFSAAVREAAAASATAVPTGGIRESREDGEAMWAFATIGARVAVIH